MTFFSIRLLATLFSSVFISICICLAIGVVVLTQIGSNVVSKALVHVHASDISLLLPNGKTFFHLTEQPVWPTKGIITLEFGQSDLPYQPIHTGIDIAGKTGDPIRPFLPGKVMYAGELNWGFGKHVIIDHGHNLTSIYAHLNKIAVHVNDTVTPDDIIGYEGQTGWATGPHLHFQINVFGIPVNPRLFLNN